MAALVLVAAEGAMNCSLRGETYCATLTVAVAGPSPAGTGGCLRVADCTLGTAVRHSAVFSAAVEAATAVAGRRQRPNKVEGHRREGTVGSRSVVRRGVATVVGAAAVGVAEVAALAVVRAQSLDPAGQDCSTQQLPWVDACRGDVGRARGREWRSARLRQSISVYLCQGIKTR